MKTKISIIAALLTIYVSTGFSQVDANFNFDQYVENDLLTAMNLDFGDAPNAHSDSDNATAKITTYPEWAGNGEYTDVNQYVYLNLEFPEEARITGRTGIVKVQFDIYQNGSIGNIDFIESPDAAFNKEVMRLLAVMPNWKPALSGKNPVKSRYQLNINFSLR
ncbi:energy transducer TonB [Cryomorpha ignava]|uniref:Energy transducer TonB n=1 Tax=Cryomorpha ignava TaxID=101383 RepID=A0A7K3WMF4_9FLAO|nr:energy transducer TonB [Cryomorpha ignava]NEN22191.1 energy transducer TonB [Cryomorpha ignava]